MSRSSGARRAVTRVAAAAATAAAATVLASCGGGSSGGGGPQSLDLALDFYVNPDHAGIYTALEKGYFERAGLDVHPQVPSDPSAPIKQVAAGRADLAVSYEPEVLLAREQGLDVVSVAAIVDSPLTSLISLPQGGVTGAASLDGKTVGTAGIPYQSDYLATILATAGLKPSDVTEVNVGLGLLPALISGKVDAILGGFRNIEGVDLAVRGLDPTVIPVDRLGVPTYDELVLVAKGSTVEGDPGPIRDFIAALDRGTADAVAHPQQAASFILEAGQGLDPTQTRAETRATLPLLEPAPGEPYGRMDPAAWAAFATWMADNDQVSSPSVADGALTNDLLPPAPSG